MAQYTQIKNVTHHINRIENKNFMIVSKEEEKAFSKTQHPIMKKEKKRKLSVETSYIVFWFLLPIFLGPSRTIRECFTNKPRFLILIVVWFAVSEERLNFGVRKPFIRYERTYLNTIKSPYNRPTSY